MSGHPALGVYHGDLADRFFLIGRDQRAGALLPARISSSPSGPYAGSSKDWVATAPIPACGHGTTEPTENRRL